MNINRNNYEEFFLLYADNELTSSEKQQVEEFVVVNSDLEEEFVMVKQSVLIPDTSIVFDKNKLLKSGEINQNNYEEIFIQYHDDELTEAQEEETKKFITANNLQEEFALLGRVKLQPEHIPYPAKYTLYRKEEDDKVVPIKWWRLAAAAVLIGGSLWAGVSFMGNTSSGVSISTDNFIALDPSTLKLNSVDRNPAKNDPPLKPEIVEQNNASLVSTRKDEQKQKQLIRQEKEIVKKQEEPIIVQKPAPSNDLPEPMRPIMIPNAPIKKVDAVATNQVAPAVVEPQNPYAQTASYITNEAKSDNYAFYNITTEEFRKSKLGGFIKRVKRVITRKLPFNNTQEQEVAIK